jgi:hypothetical protein
MSSQNHIRVVFGAAVAALGNTAQYFDLLGLIRSQWHGASHSLPA